MRGQIESKKERDFQLQQKTVKEFKSQGLNNEKAERRALAKLNLTHLLEAPKEYRVNFKFKPADDGEPSGVDMLDVDFSYTEDAPLFKKLRLRVDSHSRVAVVGSNGAGKSSLLRLLTGSLEPTVGEVLRNSRMRIGRYDQHFEELLPFDKTPVNFLMEQYDIPVTEARKFLGETHFACFQNEMRS
jgi:ATPase subunit of ABC transporter with duplicated ATPase domains